MNTCLALDASTDACVVALRVGERRFEQVDTTPRSHARQLLPMVNSLLAEAGIKRSELTSLAVGIGPGSFTGIRIAAGLVQGMALGLSLDVRPVCSLAATAWPVARQHAGQPVAVIRDARMGEHYLAVFVWQGDTLEVLSAPSLSSYADTPGVLARWQPVCLGDEGESAWPDPSGLLALAEQADACPPARLEPAYLRGAGAWKTLNEQKVT